MCAYHELHRGRERTEQVSKTLFKEKEAKLKGKRDSFEHISFQMVSVMKVLKQVVLAHCQNVFIIAIGKAIEELWNPTQQCQSP